MGVIRSIRSFVRRMAARLYWAAADTHRLNKAHWGRVQDDQSINERISADLPTTRSRCIAEAEGNPIVDGVVFTHQVDIVGRDGPELQVQSSSNKYNEWLEGHWRVWFRAPTPNPRVSGAALLRLWVRALWEKGEFLAQKISKNNVATPVKMRLHPISPARLATPPDQFGNPWIAEGIEIRPDGEPLRYYIQKFEGVSDFSLGLEYEPVPAVDIVHHFTVRQEDQLRGKPWLSSSLETAAQLAEYDKDVGDAARQAANQGVYWYTEHPESKYIEVNDEMELERGTQSTGPPGWKPAMLTPQQPSTQYKDYRQERQSEIGRPVSMPLMVVRLDAGRHNYSSARVDNQAYARGCDVLQCAISGSSKSVGPLSELVDDVAREAYVADKAAGKNPPKRPGDVEYQWTWTKPPHVDPKKEAEAAAIDVLDLATASYQDALAAKGESLDGMIAKRKRTDEKLAEAGLPTITEIMRARIGKKLTAEGTESAEEGKEADDSLIDAEIDAEGNGEAINV